VIFHCITRVVERRLAFGADDREQFRTSMRIAENLSGCRVLSYCLMCNPVHIGKKARAGLVRAILAHKGGGADARHWAGAVSKEYRMLLLAEGQESLTEAKEAEGNVRVKVVIKGVDKAKAEQEIGELEGSRVVAVGKMLWWWGAVFHGWGGDWEPGGGWTGCLRRAGSGSDGSVQSGARKRRGAATATAGVLWSARDLRKGI